MTLLRKQPDKLFGSGAARMAPKISNSRKERSAPRRPRCQARCFERRDIEAKFSVNSKCSRNRSSIMGGEIDGFEVRTGAVHARRPGKANLRSSEPSHLDARRLFHFARATLYT
jgi:hypothetical protein